MVDASPACWRARALALLLVAVLLWAVLLHRKVEQRSAQLQVQIHSREHAEHQRAMEQERTRIAHDLHDELGWTSPRLGCSRRGACRSESRRRTMRVAWINWPAAPVRWFPRSKKSSGR